MTVVSKNFKTAAMGTVFGGSLLFTAGLGLANAEPQPAPPPGPDGLVTVTQGGNTVLDSVVVAEAASAVSTLCGPAAPAPDALVSQVDAVGEAQVACAGLPAGDVVVAQNASTEVTSPVVPDTSAQISGEPTAPSPPGSETGTEGDTSGAGAAEPPELPEEEAEPEPSSDPSIG